MSSQFLVADSPWRFPLFMGLPPVAAVEELNTEEPCLVVRPVVARQRWTYRLRLAMAVALRTGSWMGRMPRAVPIAGKRADHFSAFQTAVTTGATASVGS